MLSFTPLPPSISKFESNTSLSLWFDDLIIIQVCMDRNSPDYYVEKTEESLTETQAFVNKVQFYNIHKQGSILQYS